MNFLGIIVNSSTQPKYPIRIFDACTVASVCRRRVDASHGERGAEQRGREEGKGKNDISLIVPGAVAKLVKHFAATLSPLAFSHVISFHVCGAN